MRINEIGLNLIKTFEGFRSEPYFCSAMVATIGYGSTWSFDGSRVTLSHPRINEAEAEKLLLREIRNSEKRLTASLKLN